VEVSERRLADNYNLLRQAAGRETAILAVVKANAYGHGAAVCAPVLARFGANWLGVTDAAEGASIREALAATGIEPAKQPEILVMSGLLSDDAKTIVQHRLTPIVWQFRQMDWLAKAASQSGTGPLPIHLEIDTGMARQGATPGEELAALLAYAKGLPAIRIEGIMTHFASSEVAASSQTLHQRTRFEEAIATIAATDLHPAWVHAGNSSTLDNHGPEENLAWLRALAATIHAKPMVRTGIALYGYCLPIEPDTLQPVLRPSLQPVMSWKTRIIGLRDVKPGDSIGYNAIFSAPRPMRLALLPIGYADGLRRELSSSNTGPGGWVLIAGQRAQIVGRVSMNLTIVDITDIPDIPNIALQDDVVILGDGITADDHARLAGTIPYEIVCGVRAASRLVP
jgi:alanine racemase